MGMPIIVEIIGGQANQFDEVFNYLRRIDEIFSTYKPTSEISRLNCKELTLNQLSPEVKAVLAECEGYKNLTHGFFDIKRPSGGIDPSGLVKAWAIRGAAQLIDAFGVKDFFISAGGDVQTRGQNSEHKPWTVGITNPFEPKTFAKQIALAGGAIATSGTYERGRHIYNPHTGKPITDIVSLSVIGSDIYEVDIMATAAFAMGKGGLKFLAERGYAAMMITAQQGVILTPLFKVYEITS